MYNNYLQLVFFLSLTIISFILIRAIPRVDTDSDYLENIFDFLNKKVPSEKIHILLRLSLEKFLRKSRIFILKLDNYLHKEIVKNRELVTSLEQEDTPPSTLP